MVYLAFFGGIAVAAYCLVAAFFIVGAKPKSIVKEVLGFAGPIFCALFIGVLCNWSAKERNSELPFVSGATFCAGFSILLTSLPRVIYRSAGGEPFQIAFLLRYSTYAAVVALIASAEALRPHLLQLTLATLLICTVFYGVFAINYQRFLNPKSNAHLFFLPLNYVLVLCIILGTQGIEGTSKILSAFGWLDHVIMACFPFSLLFFCVCSFGMKRFMIQERQSWFVEKHVRRQPEDMKEF